MGACFSRIWEPLMPLIGRLWTSEKDVLEAISINILGMGCFGPRRLDLHGTYHVRRKWYRCLMGTIILIWSRLFVNKYKRASNLSRRCFNTYQMVERDFVSYMVKMLFVLNKILPYCQDSCTDIDICDKFDNEY